MVNFTKKTSQDFTKPTEVFNNSTIFLFQEYTKPFQKTAQSSTKLCKPMENYKTLQTLQNFAFLTKLYKQLFSFYKTIPIIFELHKTFKNFTIIFTTLQDFTKTIQHLCFFEHFLKLGKTFKTIQKPYTITQNFTKLYKTIHHFTKLLQTQTLQHSTKPYKTSQNSSTLYKTLFKLTNLYTSLQDSTKLCKLCNIVHYFTQFYITCSKLYTIIHDTTQFYKTLLNSYNTLPQFANNCTKTLHNDTQLLQTC